MSKHEQTFVGVDGEQMLSLREETAEEKSERFSILLKQRIGNYRQWIATSEASFTVT